MQLVWNWVFVIERNQNQAIAQSFLYIDTYMQKGAVFIPNCRILSCGLTSIGQEVLITTSSARRSANCLACLHNNHHTSQSEPKHERNVWRSTTDCRGRCLTRACDRRAIRSQFDSRGFFLVEIRILSSPWMTSDPPLHVAMGPDLRRLPVRLL